MIRSASFSDTFTSSIMDDRKHNINEIDSKTIRPSFVMRNKYHLPLQSSLKQMGLGGFAAGQLNGFPASVVGRVEPQLNTYFKKHGSLHPKEDLNLIRSGREFP